MASLRRASPYQRRLILLSGSMALVMAGLVGRHGVLSLAHGAEHRAAAEAALRSVTFTATRRGTILDAGGRPLARDAAPGYVVELRYPFISSAWLDSAARAAAAERIGSSWSDRTRAERDLLAAPDRERLAATRQRVLAELADAAGVELRTLESRLDRIRGRVQRMVGANERHQVTRYRRVLGLADDDPIDDFRRRRILEEVSFHPVLESIDRDAAYRLRAVAADAGLDDVVRLDARRARWRQHDLAIVRLDGTSFPPEIAFPDRTIVVEDLLDATVGEVRPAFAEEIGQRPFRTRRGLIDLGGYRPDDEIGAGGVERAHEDRLRGRRGRRTEARDTGEIVETPPVAGRDLRLTLDLELQAAIRALLHPDAGFTNASLWQGNSGLAGLPDGAGLGLPLQVGVAVIEVDTGRVLALVDGPTANEVGAERLAALESVLPGGWSAAGAAAEGATIPGSTVKPLLLAAALSDPTCAFGPDDVLHCGGHYWEDPDWGGKCWYFKQYGLSHGDLRGSRAIASSCNVFFHELADRVLGPARSVEALRSFGFGDPPTAGLAWLQRVRGSDGQIREVLRGTTGGLAPTVAGLARPRGEAGYKRAMVGTGQADQLASALQMADAYATLCRGGDRLDPTVIEPADRAVPQRRVALPITGRAMAEVLTGLDECVNDPIHGTARGIFDVRGVQVYGKTGTAQHPVRVLLPVTGADDAAARPDEAEAGDEAEPASPSPSRTAEVRTLTHAWFAGFVVPDATVGDSATSPVAIAVCVRWGGSGGKAAAPIANQVVRAIQRRGLLPGRVTGDTEVDVLDAAEWTRPVDGADGWDVVRIDPAGAAPADPAGRAANAAPGATG